MALCYLETSALVKLYIRESGTHRLLELAAPAAHNRLVILMLTQVEFRSAIKRRENAAEIPARIAIQLTETFSQHLASRFITLPVTNFMLGLASEFVDCYSLRAYDAIQLGGCASLKGSSPNDVPIFVCADQVLLAAAKQEGMTVLDPTV